MNIPLEAYRDELLKIAADLGEPDDPFAAWESIELLKTQASNGSPTSSVKVRSLDWKHDGNQSHAYCSVTDTRWTAKNAKERERADAARAARILPALEGGWTDDDRAKAWREAFDSMHQRAMAAEAKTEQLRLEAGHDVSDVTEGVILAHAEDRIQELENKVRKLARACEVALSYIDIKVEGAGEYIREFDPVAILKEALEDEVSHLDVDPDGAYDGSDGGDGTADYYRGAEVEAQEHFSRLKRERDWE